MNAQHFLAARAHSNVMTSQSEWSTHLREYVQTVLDVVESNGGDINAARQVATWALIEVAASFAVHDVDALTIDGNPNPGAVCNSMDNLASAIQVALRGELIAHDLVEPAA